jgi:SAM-dependent methyltransferase
MVDPFTRRGRDLEPLGDPSPLLWEQWPALEEAARRGPVVELACGRGRIACAVAARGLPVIGLDRSAGFLEDLRRRAEAERLPVQPVRVDLETGAGLPLWPGRCGALLVFRYLHRPLAKEIVRALAPGGLLLYETFTIHQRELGHGPRNPAFLLNEGELPTLFRGLEPIASWEGTTAGDSPSAVARLAARRPEER